MLDYQINESILRAYANIYFTKPYARIIEDANEGGVFDEEEDNVSTQSEQNDEESGQHDTVQNNTNQKPQPTVSTNQEAIERPKNQNFNTGFWSNLFSKDTAKEALKGAARAAVDTGTNIAKMGTGAARLVGKSDWADRIDKKMDSAAYNLKHNKLGSDYGDEVTNLSDFGGSIAGNAFSMAIPAGAIGKIGKAIKGAKSAATGTKAVTQGLKAYGTHKFSHEMADLSDQLGNDKRIGNAIRLGGDLYAGKSMLTNPTASGGLLRKLAWGAPGGMGISQIATDAAYGLNERGMIDDKTRDKIDLAGNIVGFGGIGGPAMQLVGKGFEKLGKTVNSNIDSNSEDDDEEMDEESLKNMFSNIDLDAEDGDEGNEDVDDEFLKNTFSNIDFDDEE